MLEFRADPESPPRQTFFQGQTGGFVLRVGRARGLAGKTLKDMGYGSVYNLGAFKDWAESGGSLG